MTNTIVLILAAGNAIRMDGKQKQLLPIRHTTILGRILAQVKMYKQRAIIVTHDDEIAALHDRVHNPKNRDTTCDSLLSTAHLWDDRTIVLLGDVVYSNDIMDAIMSCNNPIRVFGNIWEIFAVVFNKNTHAKVKTALRKGSEYRRGRLRYFYNAYCGFEMETKVQKRKLLEKKVFYYVPDWTRDVDTPYRYEQLLIEIVNRGKL